MVGIDVRVIGESGDEIAGLLDPENLTKELLPPLSDSNSYCLRFIDPYGDTVFNRHQLPLLISEIERMLHKERRPEVRLHGATILELAHQALGEVHLYLKFYGD